MTTRRKLVVALFVVLGVIGLLIRTAVTQASQFYVTVEQLYAEGAQAMNSENTVNGNIIGKSVKWDPSESLLKFSMEDSSKGKSLPVIFHGDRPDDFDNNWPVIVSGKLGQDGVFHANQLLIKCPSKYSAQSQPETFRSMS